MWQILDMWRILDFLLYISALVHMWTVFSGEGRAAGESTGRDEGDA